MSVRTSLALTPVEQARLASVRDLVAAGPEGVGGLLAMLDDPSWPVRREVVAALALLGDASAGKLCEALRTERASEARISATVDALVQTGADVLELLVPLARDADPAIVADVAQVLGRRGQTRGIPLLITLARHADDNVAVAAIEGLGRIGGPDAVDSLIGAVQSGNFFRVFPAMDVLGRSGDPRAIAPLAKLLENPMYLLEAARALGKTAQAAAVAPLAELLAHPAEGTLRVASLALAELHARHRERYGSDEAPAAILRKSAAASSVVPRLARSLTGASPEEQEAAAVVLGVVGGYHAAAALSSLLDIEGPAARSAARALERLGSDSDVHISEALRDGDSQRRQVLLPTVTRASIAEAVAACLQDPDATVRAAACEALARTGAVAFVAQVFPLLADASARVVQSAIAAIQSLGSSETKALALTAAQHSAPAVRRSALRILGYFGFAEALPVFVAALGDSDARIGDAALSGLAYLEQPRALDVLLECARSPLESMRRGSLRALGQVPRKDVRVYDCVVAAFGDLDPWVRYYACQAAGRLALNDATLAVAVLLDDEAGQVRVAAVEALSHLDNPAALDALCKVASGTEPDLQRAALIGLGMARRGKGLEHVLAATQSENAATRLVAVSALAESKAPESVAVLGALARDADENVRSAALGFLGAEPSSEATALLLDLRGSSATADRIEALLATPSEGRVLGLTSRLGTADTETANFLCSLLARVRTPEATLALLQTLGQGGATARKAAAVAVASLRTPVALAAVRQAAAHDPDAAVREICSILASPRAHEP